jgi:hypothetical protein
VSTADTPSAEHGRHERPEDPAPQETTTAGTTAPGTTAPASPGSNRRTAVLVLGVLLVQLGFVASYVGAFHSPVPRDVTVAVVAPAGAPAGAAEQVVGRLDGLDGHPLDARVVTDEAGARAQITGRDIYGALLLGADGQDTLLVAGGAGASVAGALQAELTAVDAAQQRTLAVQDVLPVTAQDNRGLSGFYLAVGWVVGGYLLATALALTGVRPGLRAMGERLGVLTGYAAASGLGGALVAEQVLGALPGPFWALASLGALVVLATAAFTTAAEALLGFVGVGLVIVLFVVLGNPSAGGAYGTALLPPFWASIGPWLTPGAATEGIRSLAYFDGTGVGGPLAVLAGYLAVGVALSLGIAVVRSRREPPVTP